VGNSGTVFVIEQCLKDKWCLSELLSYIIFSNHHGRSNGEEFWAALKRGAKDESFDFDPILKLAFDQRRNNLFKISIVPGRSRLQDFEESTRATMTQEELTAPLQIHMPSSLDSIESNTLFSTAALNRRELLHHNSNIMDEQMAKRLHSFLLPAAQMEGFELKFSTAYDGWNLQTLYSKVTQSSSQELRFRSTAISIHNIISLSNNSEYLPTVCFLCPHCFLHLLCADTTPFTLHSPR
jgi:hypothetical protein